MTIQQQQNKCRDYTFSRKCRITALMQTNLSSGSDITFVFEMLQMHVSYLCFLPELYLRRTSLNNFNQCITV